MEPGLHFIGYLLAFFLAYLYFPNLVFKYGAEYSIDLGRRRDSGELEEFFSAVIPCLFLNGFTWVLLRFAYWTGCPYHPVPDYGTIGGLVAGKTAAKAGEELNPNVIANFITDDTRRTAILWWLAVLLLVAWFNGAVYGYSVKRRTKNPTPDSRLPQRPALHNGLRHAIDMAGWSCRILLWDLPIEVVCLIFYWLWHPIFHEEVISFYPWSVQKPWVFVRMHGDRLYHGKFIRYEKNASGDVESVTIDNVERYCYDEVEECLADGRIPISRFQGSLQIRIEEITDIHNVPEKHFEKVRTRYERKLVRSLGRELLEAFQGQSLTVQDVWTRHAGGTEMTIDHYCKALYYLEKDGFVKLEPSAVQARVVFAALDTRIHFPPRARTRRPTLSSFDDRDPFHSVQPEI